MKRILKSIGVAAIVLAAVTLVITPARAQSYITPTASYIDGSTNTMNVAGTNMLVSVVPPLFTNSFNLSITPRSQANTNLWPAVPLFDPRNKLAYDKLTLFHQFQVMASNGATMVFRYAASPDGSYWVSNVCVVTYTTNSAFASTLAVNAFCNTNQGAWPFWALQTIENPGPSAITNLVTMPAAKPGI